jgi:hypothetical protein
LILSGLGNDIMFWELKLGVTNKFSHLLLSHTTRIRSVGVRMINAWEWLALSDDDHVAEAATQLVTEFCSCVFFAVRVYVTDGIVVKLITIETIGTKFLHVERARFDESYPVAFTESAVALHIWGK